MKETEQQRELRLAMSKEKSKEIILTKQKKQELVKNIEKFRKDTNIQPAPKCISDKILLYTRYIINEIKNDSYLRLYTIGVDREAGFGYYKYIKQEYPNGKWNMMISELTENVMELYHMIRGEMKYLNKNPLCVSAALVYIGALMSRIDITQKDISKIASVSEPIVRRHYKMIKDDFKL